MWLEGGEASVDWGGHVDGVGGEDGGPSAGRGLQEEVGRRREADAGRRARGRSVRSSSSTRLLLRRGGVRMRLLLLLRRGGGDGIGTRLPLRGAFHLRLCRRDGGYGCGAEGGQSSGEDRTGDEAAAAPSPPSRQSEGGVLHAGKGAEAVGEVLVGGRGGGALVVPPVRVVPERPLVVVLDGVHPPVVERAAAFRRPRVVDVVGARPHLLHGKHPPAKKKQRIQMASLV